MNSSEALVKYGTIFLMIGETKMKLTIATATAFAMMLSSIGLARAEGCNIADMIFGKVRIEFIPHNTGAGKYETGIIFGNDTNGGVFHITKFWDKLTHLSEMDHGRS